MSIIEEVKRIYDKMPDVFYAYDLINNFKLFSHKPYTYDGTVLRTLRQLRIKRRVNTARPSQGTT